MAENLIISSFNNFIYETSGLSNNLIGSFMGPGSRPTGLDTYTSGTLTGDLITADRNTEFVYHHSKYNEYLVGSFLGRESSPGGGVISLAGVSVDSNKNAGTTNAVNADNFVNMYSGLSSVPNGSFAVASQTNVFVIDTNNNNNIIVNGAATMGFPQEWIFVTSGLTGTGLGSMSNSFADGLAINEDDNLLRLYGDWVFEHSGTTFPTLSTILGSALIGIPTPEGMTTRIKSPTTGLKINFEVNRKVFTDFTNLRVSRSVGDYLSTSNFKASFDSPYGRHSTDFSVGDEIVIRVERDTDPNTIIFTGVLEKVKFIGSENNQTVQLSGRDFSQQLLDSTVDPVVYKNSEISDIVKDIMEDNVPGISLKNVNTVGTKLNRIVFNQETVYTALIELAELAGFTFYVDTSKDLHFEEKEQKSSGITLDNTNITKSVFNTSREGMANRVWVYGDRYLAGFVEELEFDGGSTYTLLSKPHNTLVEVTGSPQKGGIWELNIESPSGTNYLVNFHDKELIFISGANIGDSVPTSGTSGAVQYDRDIPIVRFGLDRDSINLYGAKTKVINDNSIKDPTIATDILKEELKKADPFKGFDIKLKGWHILEPGNTVDVVLDDFNINDTFAIINIDYIFDKNSIESEKILTLRLDRKIPDITDQLTEINKRLSLMESQDKLDTDILTRFEFATGSALPVGSHWEVLTRTHGSSFVLDNNATGVGGIILGTLGSKTGSVSFLGDSRTALSIQASGGYSY